MARFDQVQGICAGLAEHGRGHDQSTAERGKTGPNPADRGKCGIKRSLLTEEHGIPLGLAVAGANLYDMKLVQATEKLSWGMTPAHGEASQGIGMDKGRDFDEVRTTFPGFGFTAHIRARGEEVRELVRQAGGRAAGWWNAVTRG